MILTAGNLLNSQERCYQKATLLHKMSEPVIRKGTAAEAAAFFPLIPEFRESYAAAVYEKRLTGDGQLVLMAYVDGEVAGCKAGYSLSTDCFYSWMGAVLPQWRQQGIAERLAVQQAQWAQANGYTRIRFKTRNSCRAMLHFALSRGFNIVDMEPKEFIPDYRIWLEKSLLE